jgi:hypothetical protein
VCTVLYRTPNHCRGLSKSFKFNGWLPLLWSSSTLVRWDIVVVRGAGCGPRQCSHPTRRESVTRGGILDLLAASQSQKDQRGPERPRPPSLQHRAEADAPNSVERSDARIKSTTYFRREPGTTTPVPFTAHRQISSLTSDLNPSVTWLDWICYLLCTFCTASRQPEEEQRGSADQSDPSGPSQSQIPMFFAWGYCQMNEASSAVVSHRRQSSSVSVISTFSSFFISLMDL